MSPRLTMRPLTLGRWADLDAVFASRGCSIARGCWCMFYRTTGAPPPPTRGRTPSQRNRAALHAAVRRGEFVGLLGYRGRTPVGWVSVGPRTSYLKLARSPVMKPVDDTPVWSLVCFVVPGPLRGQGIATALLEGAIRFARRKRIGMLEAYPIDKPSRSHDEFFWFGAKTMFDRAGFVEVARPKPTRPVVRLAL